MKYILFFLITFIKLDAQTSGSAVKIQYNETITFTPTIVNNHEATLYCKDKISYYKSEFKNRTKKSETQEEDVLKVVESVDKDANYEIFVDYKNKELTENKYEDKRLKKSFSIYETIPKMNWKIEKGEKKIKNYICKKATTNFRGRIYTAWYTDKIPVSMGPWKFNGLPGLILLVEDKAGIYKWEVAKIEIPSKDKTISVADLYSKRIKHKKVTFKEFDEKLIAAIKEKVEIVKARSQARGGYQAHLSISTFQEREPINEYRTQMEFR